MADISRFGSLLDPMDQEKSAVQTLQCISELLYKIQELQNSLTSFKQISNNTLQQNQKQNQQTSAQSEALEVMRIEQTKSRQELVEVKKDYAEKEKESKKLLQGAKREVIKM